MNEPYMTDQWITELQKEVYRIEKVARDDRREKREQYYRLSDRDL